MLTLLLLSISLSLDAFTVAAAYGIKSTRIPMLSRFIICIMSMVYFGLSVWLGEWISAFLSPTAAKIAGILLMGGVCLWMLLQLIFSRFSENNKSKPAKTLLHLTIKPIGLSIQIILNPSLMDSEKAPEVRPLEALLLGTTLSIDSINVGIGYSLMGTVSIWAPLLVGLFQFAFVCAGNWAGEKLQHKKIQKTERLQYVSVSLMFLLTLARIFT